MKLESKMTRGVEIRNARGNAHGLLNGSTSRNCHRGCQKIKENPDRGKVLAIFVLALLVLSVVTVLTWQNGSAGVIKINASTKMEIKYIPRAPIHINGNANFTSANGVIGGSGTQYDPYIISGWEIDANGGLYAIWIENTTAYFVIRNCNVYRATGTGSLPNGAGIALNNVTHGTLDSNNCNNSNNGIYLYGGSQYNTIKNNNASGNSYYGISLWHASNNSITNNNASGNSYSGISLSLSGYNNITNNRVTQNSKYGICLYSSTNNNITNNNAFYHNHGIYLNSSWYNNITNNNVSRNGNGISLCDSSHYNKITNNNASDNTYGIYLYLSISNTITNNTASHNLDRGIYLSSSSHNTVTNNNISGNSHGIYLDSSSDNYITNNNATGNGNGICLDSARNNYITNNNATGNGNGISLGSSGNNYITNNNASGNSNKGISLDSSSDNYITNNNASGNQYGIFLDSSSNNSITNNILWKNGIVIRGANLEHWNTHNIGPSNLVNGKPVYYYKNQQGGTVPADAGQVILANCSNMVVSGLSISNASIAIQVGFSNYNTIRDNNASGNSKGIYLYFSHNNNITNNNASANYYGIYLDSSSNNTITNNNVSGNSYLGIYLSSSSNNTITNNNASGNQYGIFLVYFSNSNYITYNWICNNTNYGVYITLSSTGNTIHHNNFIGNGATALRYLSQGVSTDTPNGAKGVSGNSQAYDDAGGNSWYDTTTQEGNYWSNWDGQGWGSANAYPIAGSAGASDWYPLGNPVAEFSSMPLFVLVLASLLILAGVRKPHKHS